MRNSPQTLIGAVREAVSTWRKRERLGIAAVVECIVDTHNRLELDLVTEITFESDRDAFRRMQTNGDRVMRWLDDETKHSNLLPANFLPSILAALPEDLRIECVNRFLSPALMTVHPIVRIESNETITHALQGVAKEGSEATCAMAALVDGATKDELIAAQRELTESMAASERALKTVNAMLVQTNG